MSMHAKEEELAAFLLDSGTLSHATLAQLRERTQTTGEPLAQVLSVLGVLSEDEINRATAKVLGIPFLQLEPHLLSADALVLLPEPFSRAHGVVAFQLHAGGNAHGAGVLDVALCDLSAAPLLSQLDVPYTLRVHATDRASINQALFAYQKILKEAFPARVSSESSALDALLERALYSSADAMQLVPQNTAGGYVARYRIFGRLYDAAALPDRVAEAVMAHMYSLAGLPRQGSGDSLPPGLGSFRVVLGGQEVQVYVRVLPTIAGRAVTLEFVRDPSLRPTHRIESLGFTDTTAAEVRKVLAKGSGLVLVSGVSETQKYALLYTLLSSIGHFAHTVITVEEKVTERLPFALQTEAGEESGVSMAAGVRSALLHQPDVLMISHLNTREVALLATEAANRGILVIAGVSSVSACSGLELLRSFEIEPRLIAAVLKLVIGVSSVRALCTSCGGAGEHYKLSRAEVSALEGEVDFPRVLTALKEAHVFQPDAQWKDVSFLSPRGCGACVGGYQGQVGLYEVLPQSLRLKAYLLGDEEVQSLESVARECGMLTRLEDGICKAARGITSLEEVLSLEA